MQIYAPEVIDVTQETRELYEMDQHRLTYFHDGREERLTDTGGLVNRRSFLQSAVVFPVAGTFAAGDHRLSAAPQEKPTARNVPIIDTHMHVWSNDPNRYPFPHPYEKDFAYRDVPHEATVEMLVDDMDRYGCAHAVMVQVIYHGWDNSYVADCVKRYPDRLKAHGLIDPTDPNVAQRLEYWMKEQSLHGMRFSPIYYQNGNHGGDSWLDASETHRLWRTAGKLGALFNFFIAAKQLPRLAKMVRAHPEVKITIDHLSQIDLGADDPEPEMRLLLSMAKYPNVWVKVSELTSVSKSGEYPFADAYPYVKRVFEAFGPDRLLFGTGYPGSARAGYGRPTLGLEIDLIRKEMPFLSQSDRAKILGGNAQALWGFGC